MLKERLAVDAGPIAAGGVAIECVFTAGGVEPASGAAEEREDSEGGVAATAFCRAYCRACCGGARRCRRPVRQPNEAVRNAAPITPD